MNAKKFNSLLLLAAGVLYVVVGFKITEAAYLYAGIILIYTVMDIRLGLATTMMVMPLASSIEGYMAPIYSGTYLAVFFIKLLQTNTPVYFGKFFVFVFVLVFLAFTAMVLTAYTEFIHVIFLFIGSLLMACALIQEVRKNNESAYVISSAFIIAALISVTIALSTKSTSSRLALEESIRQLANIIGFAILLLISLHFFTKAPEVDKVAISHYKILRVSKFIILPLLVFGLLSTMSRGALIATVISVVTLVALTYAEHVRKMNVLKLVRLTAAILILLGTGLFFNAKLVDYFSFQSNVFSERLSEDRMDGGVDIRQQIWEAGVGGLEGAQIVYGHGLSSFRYLAKKSGIDYYAHSVFIDTITSTGILGFTTLFSLLIYLLYQIRQSKSKLSFALLVYLVFNYASHGTITSMLFWFALALSLALATPVLKNYSNSK